MGGELAVLEQRDDQRLGDDRQRQGAGQHQQEAQAQPPVEQLGVVATVGTGIGLGQRRQQDGPQRHAEHPGGQLHQAVGVVHPGHRAGNQERGEDGVDDQRDLPHRHAEDRRPHLPEHPPHTGVAQAQARQHQHADLLQRRQLPEKLRQAADQHRPAQRHDRRIEIGRQPDGEDDHADVQQGRHEGGYRETVPGVEHRAKQRRQGNQQDVGEGHPQQVDSQGETFRLVGEARRADPDDPGRGQHAEQRDQRQHQGQQAGHIGEEGTGRFLTLLSLVLGQDRHERLGEGAFGENASQQVGQLEGDDEGVRCHAGTEDARNQGIADETQHAGNHGQGADGGQGLEQIHGVSTIRKAGATGQHTRSRGV